MCRVEWEKGIIHAAAASFFLMLSSFRAHLHGSAVLQQETYQCQVSRSAQYYAFMVSFLTADIT